MNRRRARGFTLIELVVTLALLGLMAMLAAPMAEVAAQRARERELRTALREIRGAIDRWKAAWDQGLIERTVGDTGYPPDLDALVAGRANVRSAKGEVLRFLRRVPRDPFAPATLQPASATWGLRSYASPPDAPMAGRDVYDVHSRADGTGLDGQRYRDW